MSILHGVLHLFDPTAAHGLRFPIDSFFRSLAANSGEHSIGVILSGMGSDGSLGLKAVKEKAGAVFVQDPASAKFDGMPRSAVETGLADVVAPVETLPGRIIAYLRHAPLVANPGLAELDKDHSAFEKIAILLRAQTGHDFSLYKKNTVYRRIQRRMGIHQIDRIATYVRFLQENPQELELLFRELLIGVTSFFRDPAAWEELRTQIIPALLKDRAPSDALRVWIPACATGEEAFSLAIVFHEALEQIKPSRKQLLQIFATDLDPEAIEKARAGVFSANIAADVSPERLNRFFVQVTHGYQVAKLIRETVIFAHQNVIMDPPFTKLDLVCCRNILIYLTQKLQEKLLPIFHFSLNPGGVLFLGSAETIGEFTNLFAPLEGNAMLYKRLETNTREGAVKFPTLYPPIWTWPPPSKALKSPASLQSQVEKLILQRYSPAAVLVGDKGDILFISGRTGKYLEPAAGKGNLNIFAMAREGLRYELSDAFQMAFQLKSAVTRKNVRVGTNGGVQVVDLTVLAIEEPEALQGLALVVFSEVATPHETTGAANDKVPPENSARVAALERDFERVRQELQTTQEESKSVNEHFLSANEELTTSQEEMQSMNEELQTLNAELQAKVQDLSRLNNDMKNLLENTEIATVFLDSALRVRLFTAGSNRIFKLIPGDVGRPITDVASELAYLELADHAREVLRTLAVHEQQAAARDGRWFLVRIMAYRTLENMIDGVVITFTDITASKALEGRLRATQVGLERHIVDQDLKLEQAGDALKAEIESGQAALDSGSATAPANTTGTTR
jgi:two-component system CheB/CheR fusion protein